ncbi:hypothetical protein HGP05_00775 [Streptococcus sanguinis]|uniref:Uncharacterized protein n=1 Tax=Streptococcus sanguinis TaxID=1305 RepID=A0A7Y0VB75_STRSA|nr:hypothetical protein [Streptococcus sanguinis]
MATYNQWQALGKTLGIKPEDVIETRNTYTNKRTGETKEVIHQGLSVKSGEKAQITLFRSMAKMIPVLDDQGNQLVRTVKSSEVQDFRSDHSRESFAEGRKLKVVHSRRETKRQGCLFTTYRCLNFLKHLEARELSKAMPNRQYQFDTDQVKTKEVLDGLCDYAGTLDSSVTDEVHELEMLKGLLSRRTKFS